MARWALSFLLLGFLSACQSPALVGAECGRASDCASPLACTFGRCRSACRASRDCSPGLRCIESSGGGVCTLDTEERCTDAICATPLRCVDTQCRTECTTSAECLAGTCDRGSCVELVSGSDAGVPEDANAPQGDAGPFACDPNTGTDHGALLDAVLGSGHGPAGFRRLSIGRLGPFVSPQHATGFVPGQIAIAAGPNADFGRAWVAYVDGTATAVPDRALHLASMPLQDPAGISPFYPDGVGTPMDHVASFALLTDDDRIRGVVAREAPGLPTDTSAWVFEQGAANVMIRPLSSMSMPPRDQLGRVTITGGRSPFATVAGPPLYYVFPEYDFALTRHVLSHVNAALDPGSSASVPTDASLPVEYVETDGSHGDLMIAFDRINHRVFWWDQRPSLGSALTEISARDVFGVPALENDPEDATQYVAAWPNGSNVVFRGMDCPAGGAMSCRVSTTRLATLPSTSGHEVHRVDLATVAGGYAYAALEAETAAQPGVSVALRYVTRALASVSECDSGAGCIPDLFPASELAGDEVIADMRVSAAPSPHGVGIAVVVLIRSPGAGRDRVWVSGVYACTP